VSPERSLLTVSSLRRRAGPLPPTKLRLHLASRPETTVEVALVHCGTKRPNSPVRGASHADRALSINRVSNYEGVDLERVKGELRHYVERTTPKNLSSGGLFTSRNAPACGRASAIELTERVRPILDALYPGWRDENPGSDNFEFKSERDACQRLLAKISQGEEISTMLGGVTVGPRLVADQLHELVWQSAAAQWATGHRHESVLAAAKAVNSLLQSKLARRDLSEAKLVQEAFSKDDPKADRPRLRFPHIQDEQTRDSMRQGVMGFGAGCFQAIRNPVGHLPNQENELSEQETLERLAALSLLARWIDEAHVERAD
jgi:uncharacterized protein Ymh